MRLGPRSLCACALVLGPAAWAQVPAGPIFQLNTYTTGRQRAPQVALLSTGDFVVVWDHFDQYPLTPGDVFARRFTAGGTGVGLEFRVNAFTTSTQNVFGTQALSLDARDNAVIAWADFQSGVDVFARHLPAGGAPAGTEFMVNQTQGIQALGGQARAPDGRFVVVWADLTSYDILARRFDAGGAPVGDEFRVNTNTADKHVWPVVGIDRAGSFMVVWETRDAAVPGEGEILAQRFGPSGERLGGEFRVNTHTTGQQFTADIAMNRDGSAVVTWEGFGPGSPFTEVWGRRFSPDGAPMGGEFRVNATLGGAGSASVAMDDLGNFVVAWGYFGPVGTRVWVRRFSSLGSPRSADVLVTQASAAALAIPDVAVDPIGNFAVVWDDVGVSDLESFGQRYGGLFAAGLAVADGGNGVLEAGDAFTLVTSWRNLAGAPQAFQGHSSGIVVPPGLSLAFSTDPDYGTVPDGAVGACASCITGDLTGTRPSGHVDATFVESIAPDVQGQVKRWVLHVGESFADVPRASPFYRLVETLLHRGVTAGCGADNYCASGQTTREQMAPFLLAAKEGPGYAPPACGIPVFADVPAASPFCRWIEELVRRGVTTGCGGGNYCPTAPVSREQMAVFVLRTLDPALSPPACVAGAEMFADVPASSSFCRWIEELARRGVVTGCGGGNYCPGAAVTREQMSVFLGATFGLTLYGP